MHRLGKRSGLPSRHDVTRAAFAVIGAAEELSFVLILVTVGAFLVSDRSFEIGALVALFAGNAGVLPFQRKLRFAVIERAALQLHALPAVGVVARFAARRKGAVVRILVTSAARLKIDSLVLDHLRVRLRRLMTFRAFQVLVLSGKRKMRCRMIEGLDGFPSIVVVAGLALVAELSGVMVFVARQARRMKPFEGPRQIANHDDLPVGGRNMLRVVALFAFQLRVFAQQRIPRLFMVEFLFGSVPFKNPEILAVMFAMATGAVIIAFGVVDDPPVHALMRLNQVIDFAVTVEALELRFARAEAVAACAL